ncbi:RNA 2'-phosphotransferase [Salinilacihabitans rarus]|uniref:RNA 2'-phosphotransferase n=1 Tax=Salinilacihabitans rarus TaxID=2961596 RepID=UPI0020C85157|nr:RNA 2'-phosphotransferase [Salinilacihabitans rarus]
MTEPIRACDEHGPFEGEACPACESSGSPVLSGQRRRRLSTFLSGALRHFPDDVGLALDDHGWTEYDALVGAAERKYDWARPEHVAAVIATDPKGRFERADGRARAAYGHSVDVALEPTDAPVPDELYHGTAPENLDAIREEGLRPMARRRVHLSGDRETARRVGRRHADDPVVLAVDAAGMLADGRRIAKRGEGTYTTGPVPPRYLSAARPGGDE